MDKKTVKKHVEESLECRSNEQESNENTNEHSDSTGPGETLSHLLFEESSETMAPERWENSAATCLTKIALSFRGLLGGPTHRETRSTSFGLFPRGELGNQNGEHHVQLALTCTRRIDKVVMVKPRFKSNEALDERVYECHSEAAAGYGGYHESVKSLRQCIMHHIGCPYPRISYKK
ncbi:hypothetical protein CPB85DRAFT_1255907 [Mucidula mucida]|nr:hypothetical protein CPB85DRAFT_1255907 [Mucidula mucida]